MTPPIKRSILDQSSIRKGSTAKDTINETIETAKLAERFKPGDLEPAQRWKALCQQVPLLFVHKI